MNYTEAIIDLAEKSMTPGGFKLLMLIEGKMPDIWDRPSSSTNKYHKKADGSVPTIAEHVYEMLFAGTKIIRMFGGKLVSVQNDCFLMAIILHDIQKYGPKGINPHTTPNHDKTMADLLLKNKKTLMTHFTSDEADVLIDGVRYHSGRWSKSVPNMNQFNFADYHPVVMFTHFLDMLSTANLLKIPHEVDDLPF